MICFTDDIQETITTCSTALNDEKDIIGADFSFQDPVMGEREEVHTTQDLQAAKYEKADLSKYIQTKCNNLDLEQKGKLLKILKKNESIFAEKGANWMGKPVQINLTNDAVPFRYRPYQIHLKIKDQVEKEVYRQCDIGALRQLSAEEVEEREFISPAVVIF